MRTMTIMMAAGAALLFLPAVAGAEGGGGGRGQHKGLGLGPCGVALMHGHPDVLKVRFKLTDAQINQLKPLRTAFLTKQIQGRAQIAVLGLQMKALFEGDLPDTKKVLDVYRKIRNLTNQIGEERIKLQLKLMGLLSKEQRAQFRTMCPMMGLGMGMRGHHDKGMGHGGKDGKHGGEGKDGKHGGGHGGGGR